MYRGTEKSSPDGDDTEALFIVEMSEYSNPEAVFRGVCKCGDNEVEEDEPKDDVVGAPARLLIALESSLAKISRDI